MEPSHKRNRRKGDIGVKSPVEEKTYRPSLGLLLMFDLYHVDVTFPASASTAGHYRARTRGKYFVFEPQSCLKVDKV